MDANVEFEDTLPGYFDPDDEPTRPGAEAIVTLEASDLEANFGDERATIPQVAPPGTWVERPWDGVLRSVFDAAKRIFANQRDSVGLTDDDDPPTQRDWR
jgi:hypothetical protein